MYVILNLGIHRGLSIFNICLPRFGIKKKLVTLSFWQGHLVPKHFFIIGTLVGGHPHVNHKAPGPGHWSIASLGTTPPGARPSLCGGTHRGGDSSLDIWHESWLLTCRNMSKQGCLEFSEQNKHHRITKIQVFLLVSFDWWVCGWRYRMSLTHFLFAVRCRRSEF